MDFCLDLAPIQGKRVSVIPLEDFTVFNAFEIYFKKRRKQKKTKLCNTKGTFVWIEPQYLIPAVLQANFSMNVPDKKRPKKLPRLKISKKKL